MQYINFLDVGQLVTLLKLIKETDDPRILVSGKKPLLQQRLRKWW